MNNLNRILFVNGVSTALAGIVFLSIPRQLATLFGLAGAGYFVAVGLFFAIFGVFVSYHSFYRHVGNIALRFITAIDWLWVLFSAILIIAMHHAISTVGLIVIAAIASWVALMAFLEGRYITNGLPNR